MCVFISAILNLSLRGLKLEMVSKDHVWHRMDKIICEAVFMREKKDVLQHVFLELDVNPTFCWFSSTSEYHMKTSLINGCLSSAAISSVVSSCFVCKLIKSIK